MRQSAAYVNLLRGREIEVGNTGIAADRRCLEATRLGVDVGAAAAIRQSLVDLRNTGVAILLISEDIEELFEICDRIAVIARGRLSAAKPTADTDTEEIGLLMGGVSPHAGVRSESA